MASKNPTIQVACCVLPDGAVRWTLNDRTSINTLWNAWREEQDEEQIAMHTELKTKGGVVVATIPTKLWVKLNKRPT